LCDPKNVCSKSKRNTEQFAVEIADYFTRKYPGGDYSKPWDKLPESIKESNRVQARAFQKYLAHSGFSSDAGDTPFPSVEAFADEEIELLSEQSHIEYVAEREVDGWKYAPHRDNAKKLHPLLVSWDRLPDEEKEKDRDIIRNLIPMMKSIGLRVYRTI
jgi:hypothetical protein